MTVCISFVEATVAYDPMFLKLKFSSLITVSSFDLTFMTAAMGKNTKIKY